MQPMMQSGGRVFGLDHRIPNGTPLENYRYYVKRGREILGLPSLTESKRGWGRMAGELQSLGDWSIFRSARYFGEHAMPENMDLSPSSTTLQFPWGEWARIGSGISISHPWQSV